MKVVLTQRICLQSLLTRIHLVCFHSQHIQILMEGDEVFVQEALREIHSSSVLPLSSASSNHANPYNEKSHQSILAIHQEMKEFMVLQGEIQKQLLHVVNEQAKQLQVAVKHITDTSSNVKAELASMIEKAITKRFSEIGPAISKAVKTDIEIMFRSAASSSREKIIELQTEMHMEMKRQVSNVINEQRKPLETAVERMKETVSADIKRGPSDKTVNQLDMIKETISREMKFYLETSGRQALKEFLKLGLESLVIPSLQNSCKTMVEQKERFDFDSRLASVVLASQDLCVEVAESRAKLSALPETASSLSELARSLRTKYTESAQP